MKTLRTVALALAAVALFAAAATAGNVKCYGDQTSAVVYNNYVRQLDHQATVDGFVLQKQDYQNVYYFVAPQPPFVDGTMNLTYTRTSGTNSLTTEYYTIHVEVTNAGGCFYVSSVNTEYNIVY